MTRKFDKGLAAVVVLVFLAAGVPVTAGLNGYDSLAVPTNGAATGPLAGATNGWGWMNWPGTLGWEVQNDVPTYEIVTNPPMQYMAGAQRLLAEGGVCHWRRRVLQLRSRPACRQWLE